MTASLSAPSALATLFAAPAWLAATAAGVALAAGLWALWSRLEGRRANALVSPALAARSGIPGPRRTLPALLALLVLAGVGLAEARPRWGRTTETIERRGADVVVVLDTSASMGATDVSPSRFVLARQATMSLLERLGGDRVALIGCEGEAQVLVPLTLDTAAVGLFLDALEPGIGALPGTSLAAGLTAAAELLPPGGPGGSQVVVVSDGEDLDGGVEAAVEKAKAEKITVHTVFVGNTAGRGAPVPQFDAAGRPQGFRTTEGGAPVLSRPDPALLRRLAAETGGTFSIVSPGRTDLDGVARAIDLAARNPLSGTVATNLEERFQIPLAVAVGAAALLLLGPLRRPRSAGVPSAALLATLAAAVAATVAAGVAPEARAAQPVAAGQPATAPAPAAPGPAVPPSPTPPPGLVGRILSRPPFTSSRAEALAGRKALAEKKEADALARFSRQAALDPRDPAGPYNVGSALARAGRSEEALAALDAARRGPDRSVAADAAYEAGLVRYREGRYGEAAGAFRDALRLAPGAADAAYNYELSLRRAEEEKKKQQEQQQKQQQQQQQQQKQQQPKKSPEEEKKEQQEKADRDFEQKAKMSREKAEQLLSAIARADLDEQKKRIAEQKVRRRPGKDW